MLKMLNLNKKQWQSFVSWQKLQLANIMKSQMATNRKMYWKIKAILIPNVLYSHLEVMLFPGYFQQFEFLLTLLSPNNHQSLLSPYSMTIPATTQVLRTKEMVIKQEMSCLMFNQILWTSSIQNMKRPVKRICMLMSGLIVLNALEIKMGEEKGWGAPPNSRTEIKPRQQG